jgi:hypothetical protein
MGVSASSEAVPAPGAAERGPIALAYQATERARLLLCEADEPRLVQASRDVAEAAYYLSDTLDPDSRVALLTAVESKLASAPDCEQPVGDALDSLGSAGLEVEHLLRGPSASSELRIALRALSQAIRRISGGRRASPRWLAPRA